MKITRLRVVNYRGIEARDEKIEPSGAIVSGRNAGGKTSVLRAIRSALEAQDIGPDAIRHGADKAEILIDLDSLTVKRVITPKTSTVVVANADGFKAPRPQQFLNDLLGGGSLDPLDLFLADKKERRKLILAALPVTTSLAEMRKWAPTLPNDFDCSGHGLEVIEKVRKIAYEQRTAQNAAAKSKREEADRAAKEVKASAEKLPSEAGSSEEATRALDAAHRRVRDLELQTEAAAKSTARTATTRTKIVDLRERAAKEGLHAAPEEHVFQEVHERHLKAEAVVAEARRTLADAEVTLGAICAEMLAIEKQVADVVAARARATDLEAQAADLEATVRETAIEAPDPATIDAARAEAEAAKTRLATATAFATLQESRARAETLDRSAKEAETEAARLDAIVRALTHDAPASLLAASRGIPGLSIDGDEVLLDGKRLDALCGAEAMAFAIEVAKRLNAKSKILIVDGLERIDADQMERFVALATADDWQLIGTRVERGDVQLIALEPSIQVQAAE